MAEPVVNSTSTAPVETSPSTTETTPVEGAATPAVTAPEVKKELARTKKLKLKVDGREIEEDVNFDDDEYLTRQLQLAKVAQKRMGEQATLQRQLGQFFEELKKNPKKVLSDPNIGIDLKQLAAGILQEEIENSQKSPEQLAKEKLETELKNLQEERKKEKETFQKQEFDRLQATAYERYDIQMTKALEGSDLPKSPYVIKKMADYMLLGVQNGMDITADDVLPLVREEMQSDLKEMFALMPEEIVEKIIGKDVLTRLRKKNVAKAKANPPGSSAKAVDAGGKEIAPKAKENAQKMSFKQFFGV